MGFFDVINMDALLELLTAGLIEVSRFPRLLKALGCIPDYSRWQPGEPLRILLVGYNGARNTGADARVEAMVRQFYQLFGQKQIRLGVLTLDVEHSRNYYPPPTELIPLRTIFFSDIVKACSRYHIAVLSEGSCFKSKFANALTAFFIAAAGVMASQGKPCVAYGSEAGKMDWLLKALVRRYGRKVYIISRSEPSMKVMEQIGIKGALGTDTAWSFKPSPPKTADAILMRQGWDGKKPLLGLAIIDPFCWPVRPNLLRFLRLKLTGKGKDRHYDKWYFFSDSSERRRLFNTYIDSIANAADAFVKRHDVFPVIIGMERLDFAPCRALQERMTAKAPIISSIAYNAYDITAILHRLSILITSRYHARVLSMTAGVPSGAISMDERLENLLAETGHLSDYYLKTDDPALGEKLPVLMEKLWTNRETVRRDLLKTIPLYLKKMDAMGEKFRQFLLANFQGLSL